MKPRKWQPAVLICASSLLLSTWTWRVASAAPADERATIKAAEASINQAGTLYRAKKFAAAGDALANAQDLLDGFGDGGSRELAAMMKPLRAKISKARELLSVEGITVPPPKPSKGAAAPGPSFTKEIASILIARCGACHVSRARGELSMATFASLSKGSKDGTIIMPGDADGSRIVEVITSGDMPRGGGKVPPEELALLSRWIAAGAKFDGADAAAPLASYATASTASSENGTKMLGVAEATGREEVQFARDVGPVLLAQCTECHGEDNPRNNFSVATFERLLRGGDSGAIVSPGKPAESLLVKKIRGTAGARMPLDNPPLPDDVITKLEKWVAIGAPFDGPSPQTPLDEVVALQVASRASHDELSRSRAALAAKNWRLMLPDSPARQEETENVLVLGHVGQELLAEAARAADEQIARLRKALKVNATGPLIKGRLTLYVFDKRYDYAEAATMLEHRELPAGSRGHWRHTGVDAYGCLLASDDRVSAGAMAQVVTGAFVAGLGKVPRWFAEGSARAMASRVDAKDPRVKLWDDQAPRIVAAGGKSDAFLTGKLSPEEADIVSYAFVKHLISGSGRYNSLIASLEQGAAFDAAFAKSFGGTPREVAAAWAARPAKRGR